MMSGIDMAEEEQEVLEQQSQLNSTQRYSTRKGSSWVFYPQILGSG
jgi:hypothetical protein